MKYVTWFFMLINSNFSLAANIVIAFWFCSCGYRHSRYWLDWWKTSNFYWLCIK